MATSQRPRLNNQSRNTITRPAFLFSFKIHIYSDRLRRKLSGVKEENQKDKRSITFGDLTKLLLQGSENN